MRKVWILFVAIILIAPASLNANWEELALTVQPNGTIVAAQAEKTFGVRDNCVIGMILVGPRNDNGWSQAHAEDMEIAATQYGCEVSVFESLNPADSPETSLMDVASQMVDYGADMIVATSDAFEEDSDVVAAAFDVAFIAMTGSNRLDGDAPENLGNSNSMFETSRWVAGCAAAIKAANINPDHISIGFLGPLINNETRRTTNASFLGARECAQRMGLDPDTQLTFEATWIGFWFNIPGVTLDPTEVANSFFDRGFQVVISGIDTTEALQVAQTRRLEGEQVWAVGTDNKLACDSAPDGCVGEQFYDWTITYGDHVAALVANTWTAKWELRSPNFERFTDTSTGATTVGFDIDQMTDDEKAILMRALNDLAVDFAAHPGTIPGWHGTVTLQDGTEYSVETALDVWNMPQLLQGMIGASS